MTMNEVWAQTNEHGAAKFIMYLWERWQDEREYEDINDYLAAVKKHVPSAYKMTKRPFGFAAKCDDGELKVAVKCRGKYIHFEGEMRAA